MKPNLAFITGTARGLGKALKSEFEAMGWQVVGLNRPAFDLSDLDHERLVSVFMAVPVSCHDRVIFVNNAATLKIAAANALQPDEIERELTVNIVSPVIAIASFLRCFPSGEVVNITSGAAARPVPYWSAYSTAKAAMEGYMRSLAVEGFKVLTLNPGLIDTGMQAVARNSDFPQAAEFIAMKNEGELRPVDEVAKVLVKAVIEDREQR